MMWFNENLYSPDKVHEVAKKNKKNTIQLINLTINNTVI